MEISPLLFSLIGCDEAVQGGVSQEASATDAFTM